MTLTAKNKKMIMWGTVIAALAGLVWYGHENNWFGTKDTNSKKVLNASGKQLKAKECSDKAQGYHCTGNWVRTSTDGCYCANGDLKDLEKNVK